jgi:predicted nuclease of predicted toxin-antitoxin system
VKFFFDNNLAAKIARGLNGFVSPEHQVTHLKEKFSADIEDVQWMEALGRENDWIIVTADIHIGKNPHGSKQDIPSFFSDRAG